MVATTTLSPRYRQPTKIERYIMDNRQFSSVEQGVLLKSLFPAAPVERSGAGAAGMGDLGTDTKTSSTPLKTRTCSPSVYHPETGEGVYFESPEPTPQSRRADRWAYKSVVNRLMPRSRTSKCMNFRHAIKEDGKTHTSNIEIKKTKEGKAHYSGLMSCGSLWTCPICAAKISEKRRQELKLGLELAKNHEFNMKPHLVTLTVPHGQGDDLKALRLKIRSAQSKMSNGRDAISQVLAGMYYGFIRALEVTHGKENGFHPHLHMIVFVDSSITSKFLDKLYTKLWIKACIASGLPAPSEKHGCTVKDGSFADEYVSKWGLEDEMTKANTKISISKKGVTPFGLLKVILDNDDDGYYSADRAKILFNIYAKAFKGARQLYWSNGLKKLLGLKDIEKTDQELADEESEEGTYSLGSISFEQWQVIRKKRLEAVLLNVAENETIEQFEAFIFNVTGHGLIGGNGYKSHDDFLLDIAKVPEGYPADYWKK